MNADHPSVLITGASSGIGKATSLHLDRQGYQVFAGVRTETDGTALREAASPRLRAVHLDVTDLDSVLAAAELIREETDEGLDGLVNNAGRSLNGPLEMVPFPEIRSLFEVNVLGLLSVTKVFIPHLVRTRGRLVNISSGHGLLAVPDKSVYAASKFAVEAISDSMRLELRPFGVSVSSIIVGKVDTAVLGKIEASRSAMLAEASPEVAERYAPLLEFFDREVKGLPGAPAEDVARTVARALAEPRPKPRYLVGPGARKMKNLARIPRRLRDSMMYRAVYGGGNS